MGEEIKYDTGKRKLTERIVETSEEYYETKLKSGSIIGDITSFLKLLFISIYKSWLVRFSVLHLKQILARVVGIKEVESITSLLSNGYVLLKKFSVQFLIVFCATFLSIPILFYLFEDYPFMFFVSFIVISLFNTFIFIYLYCFIEKKHLSFSLKTLLSNFFRPALFLILNFFVFIEIISIFFIAFVYMYPFFESLPWFVAALIVFISILIISISTVITNQAFFFALLEENAPSLAINKSWKLLKKHFNSFLLYYSVLFLLLIPLFLQSALSYLGNWLIFSVFLFIHLALFLNYLIRKKYVGESVYQPGEFSSAQNEVYTQSLLFVILLSFTIYILSAFIVIKIHPQILENIKEMQENIKIAQSMNTYERKELSFAIDYPKSWSIYHFDETSVTFYNNFTNTNIGGVFVGVKVYPIINSDFEQIRQSAPGPIYLAEKPDGIIKISDFSIDSYPGVKYKTAEIEDPFVRYLTIHLIRRGGSVFEISFETRSKKVEGDNKKLLDKMFSSLRFID